MLKGLLNGVRVQGHVNLNGGLFINDLLPIIYTGEANPDAPDSTPYYSSGGRSLIINRGGSCYRIKGCDPVGKLTERVATSGKNKIDDVIFAYQDLKFPIESRGQGLMFREDKPFGLLNLKQVEGERDSLTRLAKLYPVMDVENPCEFVTYERTGIERNGEETYQAVFRLPKVEADFRVKEFTKLLTKRLDQCSPDEIVKKTKNINRLFGRFIFWAGVNTAIYASSGLLPTKASFVPQNWVVNKFKDGYGLFRVDHSSTKVVSQEEAYQGLIEQEKGVPHILNNFSVFPGRVQIAANPKAFLSKKKVKFSDVLAMTSGIGVDETRLLSAHNSVFGGGLQTGLEALTKGNNIIPPIPEEMFLEALA